MESASNKKIILVIDDDPVVSRLVQHTLTTGQCEVLIAPDGAAGLALASQHRPDLIILDVSMPLMDGYEVAARLRDDSLLRTIPIVFLTAKQPESDEGKAFAYGASMYLKKPFPPEQLRDLIRLALFTDQSKVR